MQNKTGKGMGKDEKQNYEIGGEKIPPGIV